MHDSGEFPRRLDLNFLNYGTIKRDFKLTNDYILVTQNPGRREPTGKWGNSNGPAMDIPCSTGLGSAMAASAALLQEQGFALLNRIFSFTKFLVKVNATNHTFKIGISLSNLAHS